ncbi:MAG: SDR family oxidoreductase [Mesorhizobium sp.]
MDLELHGKTAIVTGSTGGIGLQIARALAVEGAHVVISGRDSSKVDQAVASITDKGDNAIGVVSDITRPEGASALLAAAGQVDILINNLGIYETRDFGDITDDDWHRLFDINVVSGARLAQAVFPGMIERNDGRIIFVASISGVSVLGNMIHYSASKAAQLAVARGMAELTKGTRVTVNSVLPGPTRADGIETFMRRQAADPTDPLDKIEAEFFRKSRPTSLIQRMIEPDEVASLVTYLASSRSSATNGAALRVEGGLITTIL